MDLSNLKQQIIAAIRANGEGAITGPLLQEQLLDIVDALEVETFGGLITDETVPPADVTHSHVFLAVEEGEYEDFDDLTVAAGDIWLVVREADGTEWSKTNLSAGLLAMIADITEGKQVALTTGNGIALDAQGNISVKVANDGGIEFDENGNAKLSDDIPTTQDVETYISSQKGAANGLASLDSNGKVNDSELPENLVYFEESESPAQLVDEYARLLAELYQGIADLQGEMAEAQATIARANQVITDTNAAAGRATTAAQTAEQKADAANLATQRANAAAQSATEAAGSVAEVIGEAETAVRNADLATDAATRAANLANEKAGLANEKAELADQKATLANTKAEYADEQGDYAKQQGDYAKDQIDDAKGDYDSLNARLQHYDDTSISLEEVETPSDTQMQNEYEQALARTYQAITDLQGEQQIMDDAARAARQATANAAEATADAADAADYAQEKGAYAAEKGAYALEKGNYAKAKGDVAQQAADNANDAMNAAKGNYPTLADRLDGIEDELGRELTFVEYNDPTILL